MIKPRISRLATYLVATFLLAIAGCTGSLGNEITREPKPVAVAPRNCGLDLLYVAGCLVSAMIDSAKVSPFPGLPDSTVVRGKR